MIRPELLLRCLLAAGSLPPAAALPAPDVRPVTFAQVRAWAEAEGPEVGLALARERASLADVRVAGVLPNPTLTVTHATRSVHLGATVSLPLRLFGQRGTAIEAARADLGAARLDTRALQQEARWSATNAWVDAWEAEGRARLLDDAAAQADRLAAIAQVQYDAGLVPRVDVVRARADAAAARADAEEARAAIDAAAARLALWLPVAGGAPRAAGAPGFPAELPSIETLRTAFLRQPALRRGRAQVEAASAHVRAQRRQRWPTLVPEFTLAYDDPTLPGSEIAVGIALDVPLLDFQGHAIARAEADLALARTTEATDARQLEMQFEDACHRARGAGRKAALLRAEAVPELEQALHMTLEGYRDGRVPLLAVLDAQRTLRDTRLTALAAEADWQRAYADVERSVGARLDREVSHAP